MYSYDRRTALKAGVFNQMTDKTLMEVIDSWWQGELATHFSEATQDETPRERQAYINSEWKRLMQEFRAKSSPEQQKIWEAVREDIPRALWPKYRPSPVIIRVVHDLSTLASKINEVVGDLAVNQFFPPAGEDDLEGKLGLGVRLVHDVAKELRVTVQTLLKIPETKNDRSLQGLQWTLSLFERSTAQTDIKYLQSIGKDLTVSVRNLQKDSGVP